MTGFEKIKEEALYEIWLKKEFKNPLTANSYDEIEVLHPGEQNSDASGPDFTNAKIRIGNLVYIGDVEIDGDIRDWKSHGHNINSRYNKVVLHVALNNKFNHAYVYNKEGRKIPSVTLGKNISKEIFHRLSASQIENRNKDGRGLKCRESGAVIEYNTAENFTKRLGAQRFNKKINRVYSRLKELSFLKEMNIKEPIIKYELTPEFQNKKFGAEDFKGREIWQQTLYEFIFEALGYSQNKEIMRKLAQAANVEFLSKLSSDNFIQLAEAALFNIAGLMPDVRTLPASETSDYTKQLAKDWLEIREIYDGEIFSETDWQFFRLRPQNFPTIRIAGGVRLLDQLLNKKLISVIIKKITEIRKPEILINSLRTLFIVKAGGYWRSHYIFDNESESYINYFIGASRADEILINVVFPFFTLYFDVFGKSYLSKKLLETYSIFKQKSDNRIERTVAENLGLTNIAKQTIYAQGMIELYRNFCVKERCLECEIGKEIFD